MVLADLLVKFNKTENDIDKIYCGKDNWCRCGCGGAYHEIGSKGFARAINRMNKPEFEDLAFNITDNMGGSCEWINIPYDDEGPGKCYCVYFKKEVA